MPRNATRWFTPTKRFWFYVTTGDGCWLWTGPKNNMGYGVLGIDRKHVLAHRFSYELHNAPIPPGLECCHRCDVPLCVRPDHLFLGTHTENMADRDAKGRSCAPKHPRHGESHPRARLTAEQVTEMRRLWPTWAGGYASLGKAFGVSYSQARRVVVGEHWKESDNAVA